MSKMAETRLLILLVIATLPASGQINSRTTDWSSTVETNTVYQTDEIKTTDFTNGEFATEKYGQVGASTGHPNKLSAEESFRTEITTETPETRQDAITHQREIDDDETKDADTTLGPDTNATKPDEPFSSRTPEQESQTAAGGHTTPSVNPGKCPDRSLFTDLGHGPQTIEDQNCSMDPTNTTMDPSNVTEAVPSVAEIASELPLWRAGIKMHQFYLPLLVPTGMLGNILSFLVMIQPQNRKNSCCNYMAALSVTDACMIYVAAHYWVVTSGFFRGIYYYECKMLAWTFNLFSLMGIFIILFMTIDRFIVVRFPLKAPTICTPRRARITVACIVILMTGYTAPYLYTAGLVNNSTCAAITTSTQFTTIYSWANVFLVSILPFSSLLILNGIIINTIRNRRRYFANQQEQKNNREAQLTIMLLIVTFTFLLLTLPLYARYVFTIAIDYTSKPDRYALYIFLYHLSNKLYFTNNAINFYLYCVGGAKFRKDLSQLCCGRKKIPRNSSTSGNFGSVSSTV